MIGVENFKMRCLKCLTGEVHAKNSTETANSDLKGYLEARSWGQETPDCIASFETTSL